MNTDKQCPLCEATLEYEGYGRARCPRCRHEFLVDSATQRSAPLEEGPKEKA